MIYQSFSQKLDNFTNAMIIAIKPRILIKNPYHTQQCPNFAVAMAEYEVFVLC